MATASEKFNTSLSKHWIEKDVLTEFSNPPPITILEETKARYQDNRTPVTEAISGWCEVPGCKTKFYYWIAAMSILSILGSTSRYL